MRVTASEDNIRSYTKFKGRTSESSLGVDWTGDPYRHMAEANIKKVADKLCKEQACQIQYCLQGKY